MRSHARSARQMLEEIDLLRLAGTRIRYLDERQTVIARNVANADTPQYRAQDLVPFAFRSALLQGGQIAQAGALAGFSSPLEISRTAASHLTPRRPTRFSRIDAHGPTYGEKPNGNTVSVEEQMVKSNDIANAFQLATAAYSKTVGLVKIGIGTSR